MKQLLLILILSLTFSQELKVEGNLNVTGAVINDSLVQVNALQNQFIDSLQTQINAPKFGLYLSDLDFENAYIRNPFFNTNRNINIQLNSSCIAYFQSFNTKDTIGYKFVLEKFTADGKLLSKLSAPRIKWKSKTSSWYIPKYKIIRGKFRI